MSLAEALGAGQPPYLDRRFDAAARALPDPGVTVIGHLRGDAQQAAVAAARAWVEGSQAGPCFAWLPAQSWHMTMLDLFLHDRSGPDQRPEGLDPALDPAAVGEAILDRLAGFDPGLAPPFRMRVAGLRVSPAGLGVALEGADAAEEARMRALRFRLARQAGLLQRPGHETYAFHLTLAYLIRRPTPEEAAAGDAAVAAAGAALRARRPVLRFGAPEVCRFEDMTAFHPAFTLGPAQGL